ncbi:hypothetical protein AFCDBAGC_4835 [Methylobacterium cerastii]|uniref:Uncharacterized protein n=1 Tax=Methylobacterium cerastii TaxID=932741 RepID=A0ABQ4QNU4_9HYPH|nr:hypothetical protein AFCDBAGC_4835 [Methylobacterium cerastii]
MPGLRNLCNGTDCANDDAWLSGVNLGVTIAFDTIQLREDAISR